MVLYDCILNCNVEQVYLPNHCLILKIMGDMMYFVKLVNITFLKFFPDKIKQKMHYISLNFENLKIFNQVNLVYVKIENAVI
jgi:hypothetical protein